MAGRGLSQRRSVARTESNGQGETGRERADGTDPKGGKGKSSRHQRHEAAQRSETKMAEKNNSTTP